MAKINCNDGCLDNYNAGCVKYTGAPIVDPNIPQNTDFNTILNILVNAINSSVQISPDPGNTIQLRSNGLYSAGGSGTSCLPVCLVIETSNSYGSGELLASMLNRFYDGATLVYAINSPSFDDPLTKFFFNNLNFSTLTYSPVIEITGSSIGVNGPIALVIYVNDEILYARTADSTIGTVNFPNIPTLPVGHIIVRLFNIQLDTNNGGEGIFAITGDPVTNSTFTVSYIQDGGSVTVPSGGTSALPIGMSFPWNIGSQAATFSFEVTSFGVSATQAQIAVTGINNETTNVTVELVSSTNDPAINTTQTATPGSPININVVINPTQIADNDFMIKITKA